MKKTVPLVILVFYMSACTPTSIPHLHGDQLECKNNNYLACYRILCSNGDGQACYNTAISYSKGHFSEVNYFSVVKYAEASCELNYGYGCNLLGLEYFIGRGVVQDRVRATRLFKKSCELDVSEGCNNYITFKDLAF